MRIPYIRTLRTHIYAHVRLLRSRHSLPDPRNAITIKTPALYASINAPFFSKGTYAVLCFLYMKNSAQLFEWFLSFLVSGNSQPTRARRVPSRRSESRPDVAVRCSGANEVHRAAIEVKTVKSWSRTKHVLERLLGQHAFHTNTSQFVYLGQPS